MSQEKYKSYFDIDSEFVKVVREENFQSQPDRWLKFYPHEKFVKLLTDVERVIQRTEKGVSVWVEGAYGTGKSYAVLTLNEILKTTPEKVEEYFNHYNLPKDLLAKYRTLKKQPILTAYRSGSSSILSIRDLIVALQESILAVTESRGLKGGETSLKEAGIRWLSDQDNKTLFQAKIQKDEKNRLNNRTVDSIIEELRNPGDDDAVIKLIRKCDELGKENDIYVFRPDPKEFANWVKGIIQENDLSAFVFIWDEFTEFFTNNLNKLTDFQEHIVGLSAIGFFFIPVTHRSEALFYDGDKDNRKILDRFIKPTVQIQLPDGIAFELIATALKKNENKQDEWNKISQAMNDDITQVREEVGKTVKAKDEVMRNILPLHPYAGLVLKYLAEKFDSNQRSMFDFIVSDLGGDIKAFQWFIENNGPFDSEPFMTVNYLWDFFYERGKNILPYDVRMILDAYNRTNAKQLNEKEQIVFKTLLIMIATSRSVNDEKELLKPNDQNLDLAFSGTELSGMSALNIAKRLVQQNILYEKETAGGKKIYSVAMEIVDESAIKANVEKLKDKKTGELVTEANLLSIIADTPPLRPELKNRFEFRAVTLDDIQRIMNEIINRTTHDDKSRNKIPVLLCFARDEREHSALFRKIQECNSKKVPNDGNQIVYIDMARTPMSESSWKVYLENIARAEYLYQKNPKESEHARKIAEDELKKWRTAIIASNFELWYSPLYGESGEVVHNTNDLMGIFTTINKSLYKYAPELWCEVSDNMYGARTQEIALGVLLGAKEELSGTYKNPGRPLDKAIGFAWKNPNYWEKNPGAAISKIKTFVDDTIKNDMELLAQAGIGELYRKLQDKPYGFTNCNLCAFLLGFLLKEYAQNEGEYYYSDGESDDVLTVEKIRDMGKEAIQNSISPPARPKEKYIKAKSAEERKFSECTAKIFGLDEQACFVGKIRDQLRTKLKSYVFPIWTLKEISDDETVYQIIDKYLGVMNNENYDGGQKNETEIVKSIGKMFTNYPETVSKLQDLITKDNCRIGMKKYLSTFDGGILKKICDKLHFGEQYLDTLKKKFEVDAAMWVWSKDTADVLIKEVICEYRVIEQSQNFGIKPEAPSEIFDTWRSSIAEIRVSYDAAKAYIKGNALFDFLVKLKTTDTSDFITFLDLLEKHGEEYVEFLREEKSVFKKIVGIWTEDLSPDQIDELYVRVGGGHFAEDKSTYKQKVQGIIGTYRASLGREKLRSYWKKKTGTDTPRVWSEKNSTPILSLAPRNEIIDAKKYFGVVNSPNPNDDDAEKALAYLENITWWNDLQSAEKRDASFRESIIGEYSVILTVEEVRDLLNKHMSGGVYDWYSDDQAHAKVKELAQAKYDTEAVHKAIGIVNNIDEKKIKEYLERLIRDNMAVGIGIISDNKEE